MYCRALCKGLGCYRAALWCISCFAAIANGNGSSGWCAVGAKAIAEQSLVLCSALTAQGPCLFCQLPLPFIFTETCSASGSTLWKQPGLSFAMQNVQQICYPPSLTQTQNSLSEVRTLCQSRKASTRLIYKAEKKTSSAQALSSSCVPGAVLFQPWKHRELYIHKIFSVICTSPFQPRNQNILACSQGHCV